MERFSECEELKSHQHKNEVDFKVLECNKSSPVRPN